MEYIDKFELQNKFDKEKNLLSLKIRDYIDKKEEEFFNKKSAISKIFIKKEDRENEKQTLHNILNDLDEKISLRMIDVNNRIYFEEILLDTKEVLIAIKDDINKLYPDTIVCDYEDKEGLNFHIEIIKDILRMSLVINDYRKELKIENSLLEDKNNQIDEEDKRNELIDLKNKNDIKIRLSSKILNAYRLCESYIEKINQKEALVSIIQGVRNGHYEHSFKKINILEKYKKIINDFFTMNDKNKDSIIKLYKYDIVESDVYQLIKDYHGDKLENMFVDKIDIALSNSKVFDKIFEQKYLNIFTKKNKQFSLLNLSNFERENYLENIRKTLVGYYSNIEPDILFNSGLDLKEIFYRVSLIERINGGVYLENLIEHIVEKHNGLKVFNSELEKSKLKIDFNDDLNFFHIKLQRKIETHILNEDVKKQREALESGNNVLIFKEVKTLAFSVNWDKLNLLFYNKLKKEDFISIKSNNLMVKENFLNELEFIFTGHIVNTLEKEKALDLIIDIATLVYQDKKEEVSNVVRELSLKGTVNIKNDNRVRAKL